MEGGADAGGKNGEECQGLSLNQQQQSVMGAALFIIKRALLNVGIRRENVNILQFY